jgi:hypothetical protein
MSKARNKVKAEAVRAARGAAQKNRRTRRKLELEIGDRVRIIDISSDLKDPKYDAKDDKDWPMRTGELFRFCLGREFTIRDFGKYSTVELEAGANRDVRKKFGKYHTIWMEPEFLKIVRKKSKTRRTIS